MEPVLNNIFARSVSDVSLPGSEARPSGGALLSRVSEAIRKTQSYYLQQQHEDGYWWYELESNVTMTSEYLMLLHFLGLRDAQRDRKMANHILGHQLSDGTWAIHKGGEGDLSTTVEAYFALKLAGFPEDHPVLASARRFIVSMGGVEACRVFTKIFLALFGEYDWKAIPSMPVELVLLPSRGPFNIYSMSSWARTTFVPLLIVLDLKPVKPLPEGAGVRELFKEPSGKRPPVSTKKWPPVSWESFFLLADRAIKLVEDMPVRPLRKKGLKAAERWVLEHQEPGGDWAGIQPPMVYSVIALRALGHDLSFEPLRKGLEALERFAVEDEQTLFLQSCVSPVWDTALTSLAMRYSGVEEEHPSLEKSARWLAGRQIFSKGDWSVKRPRLEPGGWAFEFDNSWYPDIDDTAVVLMFLNRYKGSGVVRYSNLELGVRWLLGMQGRDGGWGAFDVDNTMKIWNRMPFGDLEAMIDPSTPDITGRVLEILGYMGYGCSDAAVRKAVKFLRKNQEEDGGWWARWGVNYIYGVWSVLMGLRSVGEDMRQPYVRKAVGWLKSCQNPDGGWGECCESYADACCKGKGTSTPSQTAWAIMALLAAGEGGSAEADRGIRFLIEGQKADGTWDEKEFTGTGFPKYFMIRYHNYRNCFPLMALGMFRSRFPDFR